MNGLRFEKDVKRKGILHYGRYRMKAQELIYLLESAQFDTKEEWENFYKETHDIFDSLTKEEQETIIEDNSFEMLSMIIESYK